MNNDNFDDSDDDDDFSSDNCGFQRDWIGTGNLDGVEGCVIGTITFFGHTPEQLEFINKANREFSTRARDLWQEIISELSSN